MQTEKDAADNTVAQILYNVYYIFSHSRRFIIFVIIQQSPIQLKQAENISTS